MNVTPFLFNQLHLLSIIYHFKTTKKHQNNYTNINTTIKIHKYNTQRNEFNNYL